MAFLHKLRLGFTGKTFVRQGRCKNDGLVFMSAFQGIPRKMSYSRILVL